MTPGRYQTKPNVIEAVEVTKENRKEVADWCGGFPAIAAPSGWIYGAFVMIGNQRARGGDYVVKDADGKVHVVDRHVFERTYQPVDDR